MSADPKALKRGQALAGLRTRLTELYEAEARFDAVAKDPKADVGPYVQPIHHAMSLVAAAAQCLLAVEDAP